MSATPSLRWGILGCGRIAHKLAHAMQTSSTARLIAIASRDQGRADAFAEDYSLPYAHGSYETLLANPEVEAVYIATVHPEHAEWAIKAAEAGKHILCEKPVTMNTTEAERVVAAARTHDVFFMEAFMYRWHPQFIKLTDMLASGVIGDVFQIEAHFCFKSERDPDGRLYNKALGGGALLDIGCYPMSIARRVAGIALGMPFADPTELEGSATFDPETGVDVTSSAVMSYEGKIRVELLCSIQIDKSAELKIYGSKGMLVMHNCFNCEGEIELINKPHATPPLPSDTSRPLAIYEVEAVSKYLAEREAPNMTWGDTLGNMRALDLWREAIGLRYDCDA